MSNSNTEYDIEALHASMDISHYRLQIDEIDNKICALLIARMNVIKQVKQIKAAHITKGSHIRAERGVEVSRNAWEALKHHYPKEHVLMIWRSLISASELEERYFAIVNSTERCQWLAREFYGTCIRHNLCDGPIEAIRALAAHKAHIASLPFPENNHQEKWWLCLTQEEYQKYKVYAIAPFHQEEGLKPIFFAGEVVLLPSGHDISLLVVKGKPQLEGEVIDSWQDYHLVLVREFFDKERVKHFNNNNPNSLYLIGSYGERL